MKFHLRGFTLIELMIVVAIVGILASIAYPNYVNHVKKGKRAEAQAALVSFANAMELWKLQHSNSYLGASGTTAAPTDTGTPQAVVFSATCPISGGTTTYNLTIDAATASTYTLKATPVDTSESSLTLQQDGTKKTDTTVGW